ncbi:transketolase, partial [Candidatus Acetothermia bacterium]
AYHGGFIPYTATFTVFSDYMRPPIRIAAMSKLHTVFVFTHDSIGVGEDGPTHQPVEQVMSLRLIPNLTVIRPADANEVRVAWEVAIADSSGPTVLVFTRQRVPTLDRSDLSPAEGLKKGGYVLWESGDPQVILIGTGSEVHVALAAGRKLAGEGIGVRVVSLPSFELFERQPPDYRDSVLPPQVTARVAVEAGATLGWTRYVGTAGAVVGVDRFGASAPGPVVMEKFGITPEHVAAVAKRLLSGR